MAKIVDDVTKLVGNTPLVRLNKIGSGLAATIVAKLEFFNPLSSVKDRTALALIEDGEKKGLIKKESTIIEATSGNTGIGLAFVCAVKGYKLILTMPEDVSAERKKLLSLLGAEVILTPAEEGMQEAMERAEELVVHTPDSFMPQQFQNPANPQVHREITAEEIWLDTDGKVDILVSGVGTGGTITGVAEALKKKKPQFQAVAVEPKGSAVLSGGKAGRHKIEGMGAGFVPQVLKKELIDEIVQVKDKDAVATTKRLAQEEGILAGISSGAALYAAIQIARRKANKNKMIVVIFPDTGERYLSRKDL